MLRFVIQRGTQPMKRRQAPDLDPGGENTRRRLLLAAGELFAHKGYGATSIRDIAEKAGANIAAINYHYASKSNLYLEAVQYVLQKIVMWRAAVASEFQAGSVSREMVAQALHDLIHHEVRFYLSLDTPRWYLQLILRCIMTKDAVLEAVFEQVFHPNHIAMKRLILAAEPSLSDLDASLWAYSVTGQIVFYSLAREPVLMELKRTDFSESFLAAVAEHITQTILDGLRLPALEDKPCDPTGVAKHTDRAKRPRKPIHAEKQGSSK
jgi:TetR/AcrR family transcriptional regulator, regulator of cefoperazone and chloramphenicol sensitivity